MGQSTSHSNLPRLVSRVYTEGGIYFLKMELMQNLYPVPVFYFMFLQPPIPYSDYA